MAKELGFAEAFAGRSAHRRNGHQATIANAAEFFNSLLGRKAPRQKRGVFAYEAELLRLSTTTPPPIVLSLPSFLNIASDASKVLRFAREPPAAARLA